MDPSKGDGLHSNAFSAATLGAAAVTTPSRNQRSFNAIAEHVYRHLFHASIVLFIHIAKNLSLKR